MDTAALPATGVVLPEYEAWSPAELATFAATAVDTGFESVWCGETWGSGLFPTLANVCATVDCPVGTAIANVYARSPGTLAMNAMTMHDLSDGQFVLGLGASTPAIVEGFHGASFSRPLRRLRETIEIVRQALRGEPVDYDGDLFDLQGFRLSRTLDEDETLPVFNAALGSTNLSLTAEYADGWLPHLFPREGFEAEREHATTDVDRDTPLHLAPSVITSIHPDGEKARNILASHIAYYVGASEFYRSVVSRFGFDDVASAIHETWKNDGDAAHAVSEELMNAIGIVGAPDEIESQYAAFRDAGADTVLVSFPREVTEEMTDATMQTFDRILDPGI